VKFGETEEARAIGLPQPVRLVIVDDHVFMRDLMGATLARKSSRYKVQAQVGTAAAAIDACEKLAPHLLILDINLPDRNGIAAVPDLKRVSPSTRILLCTAFASEDWILEAIRSGADGFVEKTNTWNEFLDAVDRVSTGERYFRSACSTGLNRTAAAQSGGESKASLSPREREVLTLIAEGRTSKEIGAKLFISAQTVETHRSHLMGKLRIRNVAGLVLFAVRNGLLRLVLIMSAQMIGAPELVALDI
jgi:DNA-binding NarL/FixJ family response regulator